MIQLENVKFGYVKNRPLFDGVNWQIEKGHLYGLLGRNGAGKSTLLKIISGLLFAQEGKTLLFDKPSYKRTAEQLRNIYFLQEEIFVPHMKTTDFEKAFSPFYPNFSHEDYQEYIHELEMENFTGFIDKMSHGQKKKVMIAFALASNVPLLIMDEPTNGLDIPSKSIFRKIMASYADDQKTVIISTHQVRDLHSLIDAVSILDNGKMIMNATTDVITNKLLFDVDNQKSSEGKIFFSEETPRGIYQVKENIENIDSALDLELLFNAAVQNKKEFTELFQQH